MNICLIRHGITQGNTMGRYIGITDEPLCPQGIELLKERNYPPARRIYISPLKRCMMTAQILYPGQEYVIKADMAECDFGMFENKNYQELKDNPCISSGSTATAPCLFQAVKARSLSAADASEDL